MNSLCKKTPYAWKTRRIAKSPFRTANAAKKAERSFGRKRPIGFTARSSLKAMGRIPRSSGCYLLGPKYADRKTRRTRRAPDQLR